MIGKLLIPAAIGGGLLLLLSSSAKAETAPRNPFDVLPSNLRVLAAQAQATNDPACSSRRPRSSKCRASCKRRACFACRLIRSGEFAAAPRRAPRLERPRAIRSTLCPKTCACSRLKRRAPTTPASSSRWPRRSKRRASPRLPASCARRRSTLAGREEVEPRPRRSPRPARWRAAPRRSLRPRAIRRRRSRPTCRSSSPTPSPTARRRSSPAPPSCSSAPASKKWRMT